MNNDVEKLIKENDRLIMWGYNRYKNYFPDSTQDDILSIANYSLLKAAQKYDCTRNSAFSTFYTIVLRREIGVFIRGMKSQGRSNKYGEDYSLSYPISDTTTLEDLYSSSSVETCLDNIFTNETMVEFINCLSRREKRIFAIKSNYPDITQRQLGEIIGMSQNAICKILDGMKIKYKLISKSIRFKINTERVSKDFDYDLVVNTYNYDRRPIIKIGGR